MLAVGVGKEVKREGMTDSILKATSDVCVCGSGDVVALVMTLVLAEVVLVKVEVVLKKKVVFKKVVVKMEEGEVQG